MIPEKCIIDEIRLIITQNYIHNTADYLSDLMIDKTLTFDSENHPIIILFTCVIASTIKIDDIALSCWIFGFDVFGIIMKVMCSFKFLTAFIDSLNYSIIILLLFILFYEVMLGADIIVCSIFDHLSNIKSGYHSLNAMDQYVGTLHYLS